MKSHQLGRLIDLAEMLHASETNKAGMLTIPYSWARNNETSTMVIVVPGSQQGDKALAAVKQALEEEI